MSVEEICRYCQKRFVRISQHVCKSKYDYERLLGELYLKTEKKYNQEKEKRQEEKRQEEKQRINDSIIQKQRKELERMQIENKRLQEELKKEQNKEFIMELSHEQRFYTPFISLIGNYTTITDLRRKINIFIAQHAQSLISLPDNQVIILQLCKYIMDCAKPHHKYIINKIATYYKEPDDCINWRGLFNLSRTVVNQTDEAIIKLLDMSGDTPVVNKDGFLNVCRNLFIPIQSQLSAEDIDFIKKFMEFMVGIQMVSDRLTHVTRVALKP